MILEQFSRWCDLANVVHVGIPRGKASEHHQSQYSYKESGPPLQMQIVHADSGGTGVAMDKVAVTGGGRV